MKKFLLSLFTGLHSLSLLAQGNLTDSGTFIIHKNQQPIGKEKFRVYKTSEGTRYTVEFKYVDRGSPVSLTDTLLFNAAMEPVAFRIRGGTSRFTTVNDSAQFRNQTVFARVGDSSFSFPLKKYSFPIAGYAPATAQMLLVNYWTQQGKPATVNTIPFGSVKLMLDGYDTLEWQGKKEIFTRYVIKGLIWGNEMLWTDATGMLACLITNDAEGDKQEMMSERWLTLLPEFIVRAAVRGSRLFREETGLSFNKQESIAIAGCTLIDVAGGSSLPDMTILLEKGRISRTGKSSSVKIPAHTRTIDGRGKFVVPGLWDMHAHFSQPEWGPAYLAAGVTTVRDCGNEFGYINALQQTIDAGLGVGPQILKAGIIDGKGPFALGIIQADAVPEAVAAVRRYHENGFVQIKIYSSVKPSVVKAICDEAHRLGMTVTGHIPMGMTIRQGIDSGMDMVNHIQYVLQVMKRNSEGAIDTSDAANKALFRFLHDHHTVIDPTLGVYEMAYRSLKDNIADIEPAFSTLPAPLKPLFVNMGTTDELQIQNGKKFMEAAKKTVNALYNNGVTIVAGTDMDFPGYSLYRELELYVESGMSPAAALRSATLVPAQVMKQDRLSGSLQTGKNADLVILDANPLENIKNIRKVKHVIRSGVLYDPDALHRLAGFTKP